MALFQKEQDFYVRKICKHSIKTYRLNFRSEDDSGASGYVEPVRKKKTKASNRSPTGGTPAN